MPSASPGIGNTGKNNINAHVGAFVVVSSEPAGGVILNIFDAVEVV